MHADGGTPIGDAMITAKMDMDATGLSKRHILVITDGENNKGYTPEDVTRTITTKAADRIELRFTSSHSMSRSPLSSRCGMPEDCSRRFKRDELKSTLD